MKYVHAYKGIKLLFWAQILLIIVALASIISATIGIVADPETIAQDPEKLFDGPVGIILLIALISVFIAIVIQFIGYVKGAIDDIWFLFALFYIVGGAVISLLTYFNVIKENVELFKGLSSFLDELTTIFAICAIISLSKKVNNPDTGSFANKLLWIIVIIAVASIILSVVTAVSENELSTAIISITIYALSIISYIMYLVCLKKAKNMLEFTRR